MRPANILMVCPVFPWPPTNGGSVRIAELYKGLQRHFRITLLGSGTGAAPADALGEDGRAEAVQWPPCRRLRGFSRLLVSGSPYHAAMYRSAAMKREVASCLRNDPVDLVYCHFLYTSEYLPNSLKVPVCVDPQNVDAQYWASKLSQARGLKRLITAANKQRVSQYEKRLLSTFQAYVCVSRDDSEATRKYACPPVSHIFTAPNGVDLNRYSPGPRPGNTAAPVRFGFLGSLDLGMNIASVRRFYSAIWPRIRDSLSPTPELLLIGRNPCPSLIRLTAGDPTVQFTGTVDDVRPWLQRTDIFVAPLIEGAGTKLKTLEAMAMGLPVVGTALAFLGLDGTSGRDFLRADNDDEFVHHVLELAASADKRAVIGQSGRRLVESHFCWSRITDALAADLSSCFGLRSRATMAIVPDKSAG